MEHADGGIDMTCNGISLYYTGDPFEMIPIFPIIFMHVKEL
jgi:hypothetical protein